MISIYTVKIIVKIISLERFNTKLLIERRLKENQPCTPGKLYLKKKRLPRTFYSSKIVDTKKMHKLKENYFKTYLLR